MDIFKEIEQQIISIKENDSNDYLNSILIHIARAEQYYILGKNDSDYFNDVIYRSNQAYEGALKESYKVLAEKSVDEVLRKSPNEIEQYLEINNVFRDRVLQLFKNYRKEWRNKSTHDYKLFFDQSEAFLALSSVTSFVHLLLNQIQEKSAFVKQQKRMIKESEVKSDISQILSLKIQPAEKLTRIIKLFIEKNNLYDGGLRKHESEILGLFHAFIHNSNKNLQIQREPLLSKNERIRPDFIVTIDNEEIILELAHAIGPNTLPKVVSYLMSAKIAAGIIFSIEFKLETKNPIINKELYMAPNTVYEVFSVIT